MRFRTLQDWLDWLERLHPTEIDLGLERVGAVAGAMGLATSAATVFTVGGTNGKGSVCTFLSATLRAAGYRVGLYTSPHLSRFNERIRIDGREMDDAALCAAFERVDQARGETTLTYFEFGTLAALDRFAAADVDAIVLEVGLGGRLDATNLIDADVAVVTSVALDHADWLGSDLDAIAREKVAIARPGRPLVVGDTPALWPAAAASGADLRRLGIDFECAEGAGGNWTWREGRSEWQTLPAPAGGGYQRRNAVIALAALRAAGIDMDPTAIAAGLRDARIAGRFEVLPAGTASGPKSGDPVPAEVILDVAHNPAAAVTLATALDQRPSTGRTLLVLGMYQDKDIHGVIAALAPVVDAWFAASLPEPRGAPAARLIEAIGRVGGVVGGAAGGDGRDPVAAFEKACVAARPGDRLVVAGSFATVGPVRDHIRAPDRSSLL